MVGSKKYLGAAAACSAALSFVLYAAAFEPYGFAELAYVFATPAILACKLLFVENAQFRDALARARGTKNPEAKALYRASLKRFAPTLRAYLVAAFIGSYTAWVWLLVWLRHVYPPAGWAAVLVLPLIVSAPFVFPWFAALPFMLPSSRDNAPKRLFKYAALAGLWVALEWVRSFIFTGFPWLPLGNSQWLRPAVLQSASWGGVWIVSFTLVFFNLAVAEYLCRMFIIQRAKFRGESAGISRISPEFYVALLLMLSGMWTYIANMPRPENLRTLFRAGLVQTDCAGILKWSPESAGENMQALRRLSSGLKKADVDVILWPEAATPPCYPINFDGMKAWVESTAKDLGVPLIIGSMTYDEISKTAQNGVFYISPEKGISRDYYAKNHLVPFGEYVPAPFSFLGKVVPVGKMKAGESAAPITAKIAGTNYKIGSMICYEDVFPQLGRRAAKAGADILFVCTNDSWYGREAGAWQHASHSAVQAAALGKIIMRSSINGLSAVFDQYGRMLPSTTMQTAEGKTWRGESPSPEKPLELRDEFSTALDPQTLKAKRGSPMLDGSGSVYFRGCAFVDVKSYKNFDGRATFYAKYGDWVAYLSVFLALAGILAAARTKKA